MGFGDGLTAQGKEEGTLFLKSCACVLLAPKYNSVAAYKPHRHEAWQTLPRLPHPCSLWEKWEAGRIGANSCHLCHLPFSWGNLVRCNKQHPQSIPTKGKIWKPNEKPKFPNSLSFLPLLDDKRFLSTQSQWLPNAVASGQGIHPSHRFQAHLITGWRDSGNHPALWGMAAQWNCLISTHSSIEAKLSFLKISDLVISSQWVWKIKAETFILVTWGEWDWCPCTKHTGDCPSLAGAQGSSLSGCKAFFENVYFSTCLWHYSLFKSITCELIV